MADTAPPSPWETETLRYDKLHLRLRKCLEQVVDCHPGRILELGCGIGILRNAIRQALPDIDYFGCDISQTAVSALQDPQVVRADLRSEPLPFGEILFDCVAGSGILEYVEDLPGLFASIHSRLTPNGFLVASYFNMHHLYRRVLATLGGSPHRHGEWRNNLSLAELGRILSDNGFQVIRWVPVNLCLTRVRHIWTDEPGWYAKMGMMLPFQAKSAFAYQVVFQARKIP
ncbi:MAG: class I SAM-dependent methyltransferase [Candidatus Omnitrophica bacterium]|nr:class I SAM-dependent methyltransferase [bacterium]MBV6481666.1 hypothetical protein [bacterium]MBW7940133.1 class I SAM-dependent methyltransferase [Candidatus Omnitrophota bacterium]MCE7907627.1 class I SAM-dependent methyltransferase [Candidatus Omnitrophica bacterium COP1]